MHILLIALLAIPSTYAVLGVGSKQSVAVSGKLICNGQPAGNIKVKLYEKEVLMDEFMDQGTTNDMGEFRLSGSTSEVTDIDPKLNIYHKCDYHGLCYKKIGITIPDEYISQSSTPEKTYDIGTLNLGNKYNDMSWDCVNK